MAWINILGVIWGGRLQGVTTIAKAGFLAGVAVLPFAVAWFGHTPLVPANLATTVTPEKPTLSTQFAAALLGILWAYNGWEALGSVAEEIREPQKNIPRALFGGLGILIVLYVSANVAYHLSMPMQQIADSGEHAAEKMCEMLLGPTGGTLMAAGLLLSTFSGINSNTLLGPRVSFAMGRDGVFFRSLGWVHSSYRTPAFAIVVQAAMSIGLVVASSILVHAFHSFKSTTVFDILSNYVVFASSIFYMLAVVGVVVLRRTRPDLPRPYRTLAYPYVPFLYADLLCVVSVGGVSGEPGAVEHRIGADRPGYPGLPLLAAQVRQGRRTNGLPPPRRETPAARASRPRRERLRPFQTATTTQLKHVWPSIWHAACGEDPRSRLSPDNRQTSVSSQSRVDLRIPIRLRVGKAISPQTQGEQRRDHPENHPLPLVRSPGGRGGERFIRRFFPIRRSSKWPASPRRGPGLPVQR